MGCSICLDSFGEDENKGTRPVALPCGHVFHRTCSDAWQRSCRVKDDPACCPLCKYKLGTEKALLLYPSDVNDLDMYLQHRGHRMQHQISATPPTIPRLERATLALDRRLSREDQATLLGHLLDFRQHINAYVMSVNDVRMMTYGNSDIIFRLFGTLSEGKADARAKEELENAVTGLTKATEFFTEKLNMLTTMEKETEKLNRRAKDTEAKQDQIRKSLDRHYQNKEKYERQMNEESARLKRLELHYRKEVAETERRRALHDKQVEALRNENKELYSQVLKAKVESAQTIAQRDGDSQLQIQSMKRIVEEQQRLRTEADNEARSARHKSNFLADRNKSLSNKLSETRAKIKLLESRSEGEASRVSRSVTKKEEQEEETDEEEKIDKRALDDDGFLEMDYKAANDWSPAKRQRTMERDPIIKGKTKRDDTPVIVLDDQDDLDAEADEGLYRMAGPSSRSRTFQPIFSSNDLRSSISRRTSEMLTTTTPSGLMLPVGMGEGSGPSPRTSPGIPLSEAMDPFHPNPEPQIPSSDDDSASGPAPNIAPVLYAAPRLPQTTATRTSPRRRSPSSQFSASLSHEYSSNASRSTRSLAQRALEGTLALGPRRRTR